MGSVDAGSVARARSSQDFQLLNAAITARLTLEQSRRSLAEAIEAGAEAQLANQQFFGAVGHELRTPLSAILGYTEGLLDDAEHGTADDVTTGMKRDGPVIVRSCERLLAIVDSLLGAGRAMSSDDQRQEISLADAVADVIHWHRTPARTAGVDMQAVVDPSLAAWAHPSAVRQVLANLLGNAIAHHRPTGGIRAPHRRGAGRRERQADGAHRRPRRRPGAHARAAPARLRAVRPLRRAEHAGQRARPVAVAHHRRARGRRGPRRVDAGRRFVVLARAPCRTSRASD